MGLTAAREAGADGLGDCQALYLEAQFDPARRCVQAELDRAAERPAALRDAYAFLAATELAAERPAEARRAVDVVLAIDPAFEPADPMLRAPRIIALFAHPRPATPPADRALFPLPPGRGPRGEVRFAARVQGLRAPLRVAFRYRLGGVAAATAWRETTLDGPGDDRSTVAVIVRPPEEATSIETEFVIQTPDGVALLRAAGPTLHRAPPRPADSRRRGTETSGFTRRIPSIGHARHSVAKART